MLHKLVKVVASFPNEPITLKHTIGRTRADR
jgi:hypothetical protein